MKLISFVADGRESWGVLIGSDDVVDLRKALPHHSTLADFLGSDDFPKRDAILAGRSADYKLSAVRLLPVIPRPEKVVCAARNYLDHHNEAVAHGIKVEFGDYPPIFLRVWRSLVADGDPIVRPKVSAELDWEGELAVVIGKQGRHIPQDAAWDYIAGYSIFNDASIRDYQFHAKQIASGKNFIGTGPFGPWLVTKDEIADPEKLSIKTLLNGEVVQSANTGDLLFKIPQLVEYASTIFDLVPGDVIATGTPGGVGFTRKPPIFMKAGDVVEVEIEKIGTLRNPVINE